MKKSLFSVVILLLAVTLLQANSVITADLQNELDEMSSVDQIRVNISMKDNYDSVQLQNATRSLLKQEKREFVVTELKSFAKSSQENVLDFLADQSVENVSEIKSLWLVNIINITADKATIEALANHSDIAADIAAIDYDEMRKMIIDPVIDKANDINRDREITWNVTQVNSDDVWAQGYYGAGVIVAVLDTGVNYNHHDLADHIWTHPDYPYHGYDFANSDNNPMDDHGHGTHCSGTVAGDGTAGSQTGMAPEAAIMAIKVLTGDGGGAESFTWNGIEFAIEHGADVLSMSIGWLHDWDPNRAAWRAAMENTLAAGVIASIAAGNEGAQTGNYPIPDNIRTPGDCPPPWLNPDQTLIGGNSAAFTVGATNNYNTIASFSGRGPVTWEDIIGYNDYPYQPEMGLIRPDITCPGVSIKSLAHYSNTGYESGWSGTSMATPGVAGVIALMLSKNYELTPQQINQIIEENAANPQSPKNNIYGAGLVDALASVNMITQPETPPLAAHNPNPANGSINISISSNLIWQNGGGATDYIIYFGTDNPPGNIIDGASTSSSSIILDDDLEFSTTYYWKVDSFNDYGDAEGEIWNFTTIAPPDEDFETGDFSSYEWEFGGNADWTIQTNNAFSGNNCARSGIIPNNATSELNLTLTSTDDSEIIFARKTSCENVSGSTGEYYDYLQFLIDGVEQEKWAGETPWDIVSFEVPAGEHTYTWKFFKDQGVVGGSDAVYIDFIKFPQMEAVDPGIIMGMIIVEDGNNPADAVITIGTNVIIPEPDGTFFLSINPGIYSINTTMDGYAIHNLPNVVVISNEITSVSIELQFLFSADNLTAQQTGTPVQLAWDAPATDLTIEGYKIFRNQNSGDFVEIAEVVETGYEDTPAEEGNYGYYLITHYEENQFSAATETVYLDFTDGTPSTVPAVTALTGNYPNPFNPVTQINFAIHETGNVKLEIYDIRGRKVCDLINEVKDAGRYTKTWSGTDNNGNLVGSGIYFYRLKAGRYTSTKKMILMK